ncbi:hypothetical protein [Siphonobacter aquaeclarae]|uniref:Uncharacterized protein n=1 Tax=Siphonobacter aquaeclarae TaxID=563176 RepID=A0A1G9MW76_9BACT|nr:hypothetical protein [Siphonobacter aquaeclarae]SDL78546.1 hypothetical protein SAMN04488090_1770 [Siphonobacter aquaeclarae]
MEGLTKYIKVDRFRFLSSLHTTARQLRICSEIISEIGSGIKLERNILVSLTNWSSEKEQLDESYRNSKGKITENSKPTSSFNHYIDLCKSLDLISGFNGTVSNTRLSFLLLSFISTKTEKDNLLNSEKCFYFFILLAYDSDGIFLVLDILQRGVLNQISLQQTFQDSLNIRLTAKRELSSGFIKNQINEKFRTINYIWTKPQKYAEHLLIPRCEWLNQLNLVSIEKRKGSTAYFLTPEGEKMIELLPCLEATNITDIDKSWVSSSTFTLFSKLFLKAFQSLNELPFNEKIRLVGISLGKSLSAVKSSSLFKIPAFESVLFVCIDLLSSNSIVANFDDIHLLLDDGISYGGRHYSIKSKGRANESYITVTLLQ